MSLQPVDEFFALEDFATEAIYTNPSGTRSTINVIFDNAFEMSQIYSNEYENTQPIAHCKTSDVSDATTACTLKIGTTTYYITRKQYDVQGVTDLILSRDVVS